MHPQPSAPPPPAGRHRDIVRYYDQCEVDYRWCWNLDASLAMHMGYWDRSTRTLTQALARMNRRLAEEAAVTASDRVLDAGCGVGGSAIYLAKRYGCRVVGITLSETQVHRARAHARRHGVAARTEFLVGDYLHAPFADGSFDVVWALESLCYAPRKRDFAREAWRLLRPAGRVVVGDGFTVSDTLSPRERDWMRMWLAGWVVPGLESRPGFERDLHACGFARISFTDLTRNIEPSALRLLLMSFPTLPISRLAERLGLRTEVQTGNTRAALYQYLAWRRRLALYGLFSARKGSVSDERHDRSDAPGA
jgi:cyclopropane fatty-acyl-phospholipid synthase-like methyltransferase